MDRQLLSGNEAVALGALHAGVAVGCGYPGTPSTEILETLSELGGPAQWCPNEKVALEVSAGAAFAGARTLATMKHVGLNVAADPLFTLAYTGVTGGMVIISADDPGMASSQNEQDNRYYARAAGMPMLEPADSQEAYDFARLGFELSEKFGTAVLLRLTTRICHSKTVVLPRPADAPRPQPTYRRDLKQRVMIPAYARGAHRRLREKLEEVARWSEAAEIQRESAGEGSLGIVTAGVTYTHAREAAPQAKILKLGMTFPLPIERLRSFAASVGRCVVVEEGEGVIAADLRAAGIDVEDKPSMYRFGELSVSRVRRILAGDTSEEPAAPAGKPPQLCQGCPHRKAFEALGELGCIVSGDIGCYTLGVLPPFNAMDTCLCMGASVGVGLGLRHALPAEQARKVVSVIGDSTFMHSGITGLVEMAYNPPPTGHVLIVLDNNTTAMTGLQEHPGTGRSLDHGQAHQVKIEDLAAACGIEDVWIGDPTEDAADFRKHLEGALASDDLSVLIVRRPCVLSLRKLHNLKRDTEEAKS